MEGQPSSALVAVAPDRAEVDTARPFRSVKEAVAVFGERLLAGDAHFPRTANSIGKLEISPRPVYSLPAPKPLYSACSSSPAYSSSASHVNQDREDELLMLEALKKLEAELEGTKRELTLLKERESETERAVTALNGQLHKVMAKLAELEAAKAAEIGNHLALEEQPSKIRSDRWGEGQAKDDYEETFQYLPTLAQALHLGEMEDEFIGRKKKKKLPKKKPIIPLIGDLFSKKKTSGDLSSFYTPPIYSALS